MGDRPGDVAGVATIDEEAFPLDQVGHAALPISGSAVRREGGDPSLRRFSIAAAVATAVVAVPYVWVLWGLWTSPSPIRSTVFEANFYELQARAMFHGHLWLANGSIGIEGFIHGGHEYTYFGLFPSLIRMPILLLTSSLDGKLTAPFMLAGWLLTAVFVSLLIWRVRVMMRGTAVLGRLEASALGVLVATALGGTVLVFLAATPYVFSEDITWSVCLTVGSMFALLGVLERPSWGRVIASLLLVLAANLNRATTGWACVMAAVLIGVWFGLGRLGPDRRRWCLPMMAVGLVPLIIGCAVNYSKFGMLFGVPSNEQVWTHVNAYRRRFLAANHNSEVGFSFIRSDLLAYVRPDGIRLTTNFPFITLPASPATALGGVLFDRRYRTVSLPASTPLLVILSLWGLVTAFRPRPIGRVALTRILLVSGACAGAALLLWGYIAPRYLGDFIPFLVLAGAVGMIDIWRRLSRRPKGERLIGSLAIAAVAVYSIAANVGMAITPNEEWSPTQVLNYAQAQTTVSNLTGFSLRSQVHRGRALPPYAPADRYFVIGNCDGLYISNGEDYATVPAQLFERSTWMAVERGHSFQHTFRVVVGHLTDRSAETLPMVTIGPRKVFVKVQGIGNPRLVRLTFGLYGGGGAEYSTSRIVTAPTTHVVTVITDPAKRLVDVSTGGRSFFARIEAIGGPISVASGLGQSTGSQSALKAVDVTTSTPEPTLCRSLIGEQVNHS